VQLESILSAEEVTWLFCSLNRASLVSLHLIENGTTHVLLYFFHLNDFCILVLAVDFWTLALDSCFFGLPVIFKFLLKLSKEVAGLFLFD
jgi:hypothetical protein